ncbi:MAG: hypothetical protein Q9225_003869 [Loekoesia sp. 1 TL-2023]
MAEAMATVGFVAAIANLSCFAKKLVDRWKEFHSRSKHVPKAFRSIYTQLPLVVSSLEQIRNQAEGSLLSEDLIASLQPVIEACHEEVKDLEIILNKILPAPSASSWDRNALVLRSLRYEAEVKKSTANLDSHLQKLMFYQVNISAARISQLHLNHSKEPPGIFSLIDQPGQLIARPSLLKESIDNLAAIEYPYNGSRTEDFVDENELVPQNVPLGQGPLPRILRPRPNLDARNPLEAEAFETWCTCRRPRIQHSWTKAVFGATFRSESVYTHRRGCPLFREDDELTKISFDISLVSRLLNTAVRLSFSLQCGAGGMSVSPNLTLRGMKQPDSPVFALIKTLNRPGLLTSERIVRMDEILPRIKLLIQSGQASPHDVDLHGRTVFDAFFDRREKYLDESKPTPRGQRDSFIKSLCYLGFSSNEESCMGFFGRG